MRFPTTEQGHQAHQRGQDDALAGASRDACPWNQKAADSVERCLALAWQQGHAYGVQIKLQQTYGDPPKV